MTESTAQRALRIMGQPSHARIIHCDKLSTARMVVAAYYAAGHHASAGNNPSGRGWLVSVGTTDEVEVPGTMSARDTDGLTFDRQMVVKI